MTNFLTLSLGLIAAVSASALPQSQLLTAKTSYITTFEDLPDPVPAVVITPVGVVNQTRFQGMNLGQSLGVGLLGVPPNTPRNFITFSGLGLSSTLEGRPSMLAKYDNSRVESFDLDSFFYGCTSVVGTSTGAIPVRCTITINGYKDDAGTQFVGQQKFEFGSEGGLLSGLLPGLLPNLLPGVLVDLLPGKQLLKQQIKASVDHRFRGLRRVDFFVDNSLTTTAVLDTFRYTVTSRK
jgi:hypothetical protein